MSTAAFRTCEGCGLRFLKTSRLSHAYIGASPECWALYETVLAREYSEPSRFHVHGLTVDAYAAQHPGTPGRRTAKSVNLHLLGLHLVLERSLDPAFARRMMGIEAARTSAFPWLAPPTQEPELTLAHVACATDPADHCVRTKEWAEAVWLAWAPHHDYVASMGARVIAARA